MRLRFPGRASQASLPLVFLGARGAREGGLDLDGDGRFSDVDCDDLDVDVFPGHIEICDGEDNNCNSLIDDANSVDTAVCFHDADADGYEANEVSVYACDEPDGYAALGDDMATAYHLGTIEVGR
jgi:hypothetical protein